MASLYTQQSRNIQRTFFLMALFLMIVIAIAFFASYYFDSPLILYVVVFIAIAINIVSYWRSDKVVIKLTKAQPINREEYFEYWTLVENLCISIGVEMPKLYIIEDQSPNAFATGRNPKNSAIVVTRGLLEMMDKNELEGVLAHELAHIQNRDTLLMTSVVVLFGIVTILLDLILRAGLIGGGDKKNNGALLVITIAAYLIVPIVLSIIRFSISRKREFLADATAGVYTRYPEGLASALEKIGNSNKPMKNASSATAHLFISDPFSISDHEKQKKKKGFGLGIHRLFDTHPPINDRIEKLINKKSTT